MSTCYTGHVRAVMKVALFLGPIAAWQTLPYSLRTHLYCVELLRITLVGQSFMRTARHEATAPGRHLRLRVLAAMRAAHGFLRQPDRAISIHPPSCHSRRAATLKRNLLLASPLTLAGCCRLASRRRSVEHRVRSQTLSRLQLGLGGSIAAQSHLKGCRCAECSSCLGVHGHDAI